MVDTLSANESKLFELNANSYPAAIASDRLYDRTEISADINDRIFKRVGTVNRAPGWRTDVVKSSNCGFRSWSTDKPERRLFHCAPAFDAWRLQQMNRIDKIFT